MGKINIECKFITPLELKKTYITKGYFENSQKRVSAEISQKDSKQDYYDILFILLNPGSSKPIKNNDYGQITEISPDPTMYQLMRIMSAFNFQKSLILNLSSKINPNMNSFYKELKNIDNEYIENYLINIEDTNLLKCKYLIFAWGGIKNEEIKCRAKKLVEKYPKALSVSLNNNFISHPSPRYTKKEWLNNLCTQLNNQIP